MNDNFRKVIPYLTVIIFMLILFTITSCNKKNNIMRTEEATNIPSKENTTEFRTEENTTENNSVVSSTENVTIENNTQETHTTREENTTQVVTQTPTQHPTEEFTQAPTQQLMTQAPTEKATEEIIDQDVEIILSMVSFDENETIEDYVLNLNKENNNTNYYVYDDMHFATKIKESERQAILKTFENEELSKQFIENLEVDYHNVIKRVNYNNSTKVFIIYVDSKLYSDAGFGIYMVSTITGMIYVDMIQAYNLIPITERTFKILIVDNATNELIDSTE